MANRYQGSGLRVISRSLISQKEIEVDPVNGNPNGTNNNGTNAGTNNSGKGGVYIEFTPSPIRVDWRQLR
jgi:hypothetical protein